MNHADLAHLESANEALEQAAMNQLAQERRNRVLDALYAVANADVATDDLRVLCGECGVSWDELLAHRPTRTHVDDPEYPLPF